MRDLTFVEEVPPTTVDGLPVEAPGRQWLALVGGQRVGHLYVSAKYRGRLDAYIAPSYRGVGIGRLLYLHVASQLGHLESLISEQSPSASRLWVHLAETHRVERDGRFVTLYPYEFVEPPDGWEARMMERWRSETAYERA